MRRSAWVLLLLYVFTIPWEYSLDLEAPYGNIARITGLVLLLFAVPAVLAAGRMRSPGFMQWLTLALYSWLCLSLFWTPVPDISMTKMRAYPQELMIVWLIWEFADSAHDLRSVMRAWLAGSWVLAILTIANFAILYQDSPQQSRFAAFGQDPNDVARFLDLGFPIAALLLDGRERWFGKLAAIGYLPLGFACVVLTGSRGGFVAAIVALIGCGLLLVRRVPRIIPAAMLGLPAVALATWFVAPLGIFERIASIGEQLQTGDLNQRLNIWTAGWHAFFEAPLCGHGAGSFVAAARLAPIDTAHNTILSIVVEGGLVSLALATAILAASIQSIAATKGPLRLALMTLMSVWFVSSLVGTVGESRTTWLLLGIIAVSHRLQAERPEDLEQLFSTLESSAKLSLAERFS
jgi:O-antigen ligase